MRYSQPSPPRRFVPGDLQLTHLSNCSPSRRANRRSLQSPARHWTSHPASSTFAPAEEQSGRVTYEEMTTPPPQHDLPIGRALEYIAATSAIFLFACYIAGRIYLQAFYRVFNVGLPDLDLSVQDVMFQSWRAFLEPILASLIVLALLPSLRRFVAFEQLLEDAKTRIAEITKRLEAEGETPELASELQQLEEDVDHLFRRSGAATFERLLQTHPLLRAAVQHLPHYLVSWLATVPFFGAVFLLTEWWRYGPKSAAIDTGMYMLTLATVLAVFWAITQSIRGSWSIRENAVAVTLLILVLAGIPLTTGTGRAYSIRLDNQPGRGLPEITLVADRPIAPTWRLDGLEYASQPLRWLGQNDTYIVAWDPAAPERTLYINKAGITRIERKR